MITDRMREAFRRMEGGLFSRVAKADVGDVAEQMKARNVAFMSWADPFMPSASMPGHVAEAMIRSIRDGGAEHYTMPIGSPELKKVIAEKLKRMNGLDVVPERNILITPGSDAALFFAMLPFIEDGDEIMIVDPSYPNNFQNTEILGGKIVRIPVYMENGFQFSVSDFEKKLTDRTKMVVLTNPNNPTTTVYRRESLEGLARFIVENDLICVVDQAFEEAVFDGAEMVTAASLPGMWERTLTVFSLSKGMGLSGLRVGYIVADDRIMDKLYASAVSVLGATGTAPQAGAIAALRQPGFAKEYAEIFERRRRIVYESLRDVPGVKLLMPESGFLAWADVSGLGTDDEVACYLAEHARAAVNTGSPYGEQGKDHIRIVYGVFGEDGELADAMGRIRNALMEMASSKGLRK